MVHRFLTLTSQHEETAMGNPLSPFILGLSMDIFQQNLKVNLRYFPRVWDVYDIFAICDTIVKKKNRKFHI